MIDMRGPETAQFGMTLSLLARYFHYTRRQCSASETPDKIEATAKLLDRHARRKSPTAAGQSRLWTDLAGGVNRIPASAKIRLCIGSRTMPTAHLRRAGSKISQKRGCSWPDINFVAGHGDVWRKTGSSAAIRSRIKPSRASKRISRTIRLHLTSDYFREPRSPFASRWRKNSPVRSNGRTVLMPNCCKRISCLRNLANQVIDCMRAYGATTLGVVPTLAFSGRWPRDSRLYLLRIRSNASAARPHRGIPAVSLFASLSCAHARKLDGGRSYRASPATREPIVFRRNRRSRCWFAGCWCSKIPTKTFCILAKGVPREWVGSGKEIRIEQAPTRWGKVTFSLMTKPDDKVVVGQVELRGATAPKEVHFKLRLPTRMVLQHVTVNGEPASVGGIHGDTVVIPTANNKRFEIVGKLG